MSISIILADDHPVVRQGLRVVLENQPDFTIVAETGDGIDAVRQVERLHPRVLVLDLRLPGLGGLDVLPIVKQRSPETRCVIFSMCTREDFVVRAMKNGALAYVVKGCDPRYVVEAVRQASEGKMFLGPALTDAARTAILEKSEDAPIDPHDQLTPREREVLQLAAEGCTSAEIAGRLSISPRTVEMHRAHAFKKLALRSQIDLIRYAIRRGLIPAE